MILITLDHPALLAHSLGLLGLPADHVGDELAIPLGHFLALLLAAHGAHGLSDRGAVCDSSVNFTWLECRAHQRASRPLCRVYPKLPWSCIESGLISNNC